MIYNIPQKPLIYALALHLGVMAAFTINFHTHSNQPLELVLPQFNQPTPNIVQATAVSQATVDAKIQSIRQAEQRRIQAEINRQKEQQRLAAERKAEAERKQREKEQAEARAREEEQRRIANAEAAEQRRLAEAQAAEQRAIQTQLQHYSQQLLAAIAREWIISAGINRDLSARFYVRMARDGTVETVSLIESSGDTRLDQSARNAILKASPLPVPQNPALYEKVKEINLTVSPREVLRYND